MRELRRFHTGRLEDQDVLEGVGEVVLPADDVADAQVRIVGATPVTFQNNAVTMIITEDLDSIAAKGAWAKAGNCGGTIVWVINYGYVDSVVGNPPMDAIKQAFR